MGDRPLHFDPYLHGSKDDTRYAFGGELYERERAALNRREEVRKNLKGGKCSVPKDRRR